MTDEDETVWIVPRLRSSSTPKLHTDKECPALKGRRGPVEKPRSNVPNHEMCKHCEGYEHPGPQESTRALSDRLSKTDPEEFGLSPLERDRE